MIKQVYCPVTHDQEIDPEVFTDSKGKRIYFCCDRCGVKFNRDPEAYTVRLVNAGAISQQPAVSQPHDQAHEHAHQTGDQSPATASEHGEAGRHDDAAATATSGNGGATHHDDEGLARPGSPEHEHQEHGPGSGPRWLNWIGGFHPPSTNIPIGVLIAGALAEALFIMTRRSQFEHAARFCIMVAAMGGVAAGVLGWCFGGFHLSDPDKLLTIHRWFGTGTVLWLVVLLWSSERTHRHLDGPRGLYRLLLFGGTTLALTTGFFGRAMVYGLDHYAWW